MSLIPLWPPGSMSERMARAGVRRAATLELDSLRAQIQVVQAELDAVRLDLAAAKDVLRDDRSAQLVEANEQLMHALMRERADAQAATLTMESITQACALDALTGLPGRALLQDRLTQTIAVAHRQGSMMGVLFFDLDDLKQINDTLGHAAGDDALRHVAGCAASILRATDTASRYGGDEFVIVLADVKGESDAQVVANKLVEALALPRPNGAAGLTASIGIALYPMDGEDPESLIAAADAAMYLAKRAGKVSRPAELQTEAPAPRASFGRDAALAGLREANANLTIALRDAEVLLAGADASRQRQTEFLALIAHELRNPLAPIRYAAATLDRIESTEPLLLGRLRSVIERQVVHMTRLVDDLLDLSRIGTGTLHLVCEPVDLCEVLRVAIESCRQPIEARSQHLILRLPPTPMPMSGDAMQLTQVFVNLLDNASKYTPEGGSIDVELAGGELSSADAIITISDDGIGISPAALMHVFEPFVQEPRAIGFHHSGLGIGLAVVRKLVDAHGGHVTAHSEGTGRGSKFVLSLPKSAIHAP